MERTQADLPAPDKKCKALKLRRKIYPSGIFCVMIEVRSLPDRESAPAGEENRTGRDFKCGIAN